MNLEYSHAWIPILIGVGGCVLAFSLLLGLARAACEEDRPQASAFLALESEPSGDRLLARLGLDCERACDKICPLRRRGAGCGWFWVVCTGFDPGADEHERPRR